MKEAIADFKAGFAFIASRDPLIGEDYIVRLLQGNTEDPFIVGKGIALDMVKEGWKF